VKAWLARGGLDGVLESRCAGAVHGASPPSAGREHPLRQRPVPGFLWLL